jgi:hypothetical protein
LNLNRIMPALGMDVAFGFNEFHLRKLFLFSIL